MAELIKNEKLKISSELSLQNDRCKYFTNTIMKHVVNGQQNKNGYFNCFWGPYSVNCDDFEQFVKNANDDHDKKIYINYESRKLYNIRSDSKVPYVNHITTNIDVQNDIVTYNLTYKD